MQIIDAVAIVSIRGQRRAAGELIINDGLFPDWPPRIEIEGRTFHFSDVETIHAGRESPYMLGHYVAATGPSV